MSGVCLLLAGPAQAATFLVRSQPSEDPVQEKISTQGDFDRVVRIREARYLCPVDQPELAVTSVQQLVQGVEYMAVYGERPVCHLIMPAMYHALLCFEGQDGPLAACLWLLLAGVLGKLRGCARH